LKFIIHHYSDIDSTQSLARHYLLEEEADEGTVVIADQQSAGYGRQKRHWESPPGNLYLSLILKPEGKPIETYSQLAFVMAVGIKRALHSFFSSLPLSLKWPNDVLVDGKKISGILIEVEGESVIIGVGVNVNSSPSEATHLNEYLYSPVTIEDVLKSVLKSLWQTYQEWSESGFEMIQKEWTDHAYMFGQALERDGTMGTFVGLSAEGAMLLKTEDGSIQKITKVD